ncbi:hypothetical protein LZF95_15345 [Algoriphagus sp. AGSA1]|uniref:hypothetical protein n=1 Tax=Algoriphagus sp. AGSA1 TaxID=2907213 RepID=UPI001F4625F3|nr:hypothetical protein [Algoriphagus sp. AGSA1]MCE7056056.1 hypothetical protein [Algoriphagus sp. AGSA1]
MTSKVGIKYEIEPATGQAGMSITTHTGMIMNAARFSRSAEADGTGYVTIKKTIINT